MKPLIPNTSRIYPNSHRRGHSISLRKSAWSHGHFSCTKAPSVLLSFGGGTNWIVVLKTTWTRCLLWLNHHSPFDKDSQPNEASKLWLRCFGVAFVLDKGNLSYVYNTVLKTCSLYWYTSWYYTGPLNISVTSNKNVHFISTNGYVNAVVLDKQCGTCNVIHMTRRSLTNISNECVFTYTERTETPKRRLATS